MKVISIGVLEKEDQVSSWIAEHQLTYSVIADPYGIVYKKYGTCSVPYHVIIDKDFRIRLSQEAFEKEMLIRVIRGAL